MVSLLDTPARAAAPLKWRSLFRALASGLLPGLLLADAVAAGPPGAGTPRLIEPTEKELRQAYLDFLYDFVAIHGEMMDPGCSLAGAGCSVQLLDVRRDYRMTAFKKKACHPTEPVGFACSFEATVTCRYTTKVPTASDVADLYCEPVFNKSSTYIAQLEVTSEGWLITRFLEG